MLNNGYDSQKYREYVEEHYSLEKQVSAAVKLITALS
jgi:hypothetical protein